MSFFIYLSLSSYICLFFIYLSLSLHLFFSFFCSVFISLFIVLDISSYVLSESGANFRMVMIMLCYGSIIVWVYSNKLAKNYVFAVRSQDLTSRRCYERDIRKLHFVRFNCFSNLISYLPGTFLQTNLLILIFSIISIVESFTTLLYLPDQSFILFPTMR